MYMLSADPMKDLSPLRERNRQVLRRTLSIISWIYSAMYGLFVPIAFLAPEGDTGVMDIRTLLSLMAGHMAMLVAAGWALWKPRTWAWTAVVYAAVGACVFAAIMMLHGDVSSGVMYVLYAVLALGIYVKTRAPS